MLVPFSRKRTARKRIGEFFRSLPDRARLARRGLVDLKYSAIFLKHGVRRLVRRGKYAAADAVRRGRKMTRHTEAALFSLILILAALMFVSAGGADMLTSLILIVLLVLVSVIYLHLKFQQRMLNQYLPRIGMVRIKSCRMYSDRIRTVNVFGALEKLDAVNRVRNVDVSYVLLNDSFAPVSVDSASLDLKLKKGRTMSLSPEEALLSVNPKSSAEGKMGFRLRSGVDFDSIDWLELELSGTCKKKVRLKPELYVNLMLRGKTPELVFEPFSKFMKRKDLSRGR